MSGRRYTFERWTLDCDRGALTSASGEIALRPKSFEVLRFLIENAGRLVSRDDILGAVWPGVVVTEESLTQCVSEIRQALGDSGQRIIKTLPKRGYMFAIDVREGAAAPAAAPLGAPAGADPGPPVIADRSIDGPSVAVLPFTNLSGDAAQDYLSDGLTEDVINGLSYFSDLSVIASNSSFGYKGRPIDVREVGRQLGARYIVEGSARRFGERIRITAQLVDASTGVRRWAERFDRALGDIFAVQDEITQSIVRVVVAHLSNAEIERITRKPPTSWTAYDLMMQGDQAQRRLEESWDQHYLREAGRLFGEAFAIDPDNARISAKLGHVYVRAFADPASQDVGKVDQLHRGYELARKAVSLDPNLPLARAQLAWAYFWMGDLDSSIREFEKAVALNPNFADYRLSAVLVFHGDPLRAMDVLQAHVRLDPFHPAQLHAIHGHALYLLKRYSDALGPLRECIRRGPENVLGQVWLAATLVRLERAEEARAIVAEAVVRLPKLSIKDWPMFSLYRNREDATNMVEALKAAGFP